MEYMVLYKDNYDLHVMRCNDCNCPEKAIERAKEWIETLTKQKYEENDEFTIVSVSVITDECRDAVQCLKHN